LFRYPQGAEAINRPWQAESCHTSA